MAKRGSKADSALIGILLVFGVPIYLLFKLVESVGWILPLAIVAGAIALFIWFQSEKKKKRLEYLRTKYADEEVVRKILAGYMWQGQTEEQLKDAIGAPVAVDRAVLKTKSKETWKYNQSGVNRFGLRVVIENGRVIGWDKKA